jgi:spore germination protein GerM
VKRIVLVLAVVALGLVACGVPEDDSPQELSADDVPFGLLSTPTTTTPDEEVLPENQAELWFVNADAQLTAVDSEVPSMSVDAVITALLDTDPETLAPGVSSFIPPETALLDSSIEDGVLTVDLSDEFNSITGDRASRAVAQIVLTAAAFPGGSVDRVAFEVEGEHQNVNDDRGRSQSDPVSPNDYQGFLAING